VVLTGNPPRACLLPELRCATELLPQTCLSAYLRSNRRSHLSGLLRVFDPGLAPLHVLPNPACGGHPTFGRHPPPAGPATVIRLSSNSDPQATLPARFPAFAVLRASGAIDASALFPRLLCLRRSFPCWITGFHRLSLSGASRWRTTGFPQPLHPSCRTFC